SLVHLLDVFPVYQMIEKRLDVIRPPVAVVDIVGVLPNIAAQNRFGAVHQRVLAIRRFSHSNLAVLDGQPSPSGSELSDASGNELLLHLVIGTKVFGDLLLEIARELGAAAAGFHPFPKMQMVVVLARIVEESRILAERAGNNLLKRLSL